MEEFWTLKQILEDIKTLEKGETREYILEKSPTAMEMIIFTYKVFAYGLEIDQIFVVYTQGAKIGVTA